MLADDLEVENLDNDKDFSAKVLSVIKENLFEFKKLLFNLDDCVSKKDFDKLQQDFDAAQDKIEKLEGHKTRLENEVSNKATEITDLIRQNSDMRDKVYNQAEELNRRDESLKKANTKIDELENNLEKTTAELQNYVENYSELEKAYNSYKKLSDNTKFALEGIFGAESSPTNFLAGALQEGHLESLFDYVATMMNSNAAQDEIETLHALFEFAFSAANSGIREKIYTRLEISEGDDFYGEEMRKTSNSEQSGSVKKILLDGYKYSRTDKVVKTSLVVIG